jgi:anthranilate phosphoribosyltransferase
VALNAGAAIYVAGVAKSLKAGVAAATQAIKSGAAKKRLEDFVAFSQRLKKA